MVYLVFAVLRCSYRIFTISFFINLSFFSVSYADKQQHNDLLKQACIAEGGVWKLFSNGCADSCSRYNQKEVVMCTMALTYSCECGEKRCFNSQSKKCQDHD